MQRTLNKLKAGDHVTIVALGDSITELTFHTQGGMNWVGFLSEAILETYGNGICTMINVGKCGESYRGALERLERDVLRFEPDLVIIALGMNDACAGPEGLPAFRANVDETLDRIQAIGAEILLRTPNPVVTVHGLPKPPEQDKPGRPWESPQRPLGRYVAVLNEIATERDVPIVDHYKLWSNATFEVKQPVADPTGLWPRMGDAIHPGYLGHLIFFRELAPLFGLPRRFPWEGVTG